MCGISGLIAYHDLDLHTIAKNMSEALIHRGPDDYDKWIDKERRIAFAFRRLSIIDLTIKGRQPIHSYDNRYVMVFNGEIFNYKSIKELIIQKKNIKLKGTSDSEILVNSFSVLGINETLNLVKGQFAIVLWDKFNEKIHLIRDRMGEKPLYFGFVNNDFVFASELKSIKKHPEFNNKINFDILNLYFKYLAIPEPYSIYNNIYKLLPGSILSIKYQNIFKCNKINFYEQKSNNFFEYKRYWSLYDIATKSNIVNISRDKIITTLEKKLLDSINIQSQADVNLGVFLSSGVDSSLIASLMQSQSALPINTFSVGFDNDSYNETTDSKKIAKFLGTNHHEINVDSNDALNLVDKINDIYCEPFADSSQIPTYLLCKQVSKYTTVALGGDGGDELFGGYNRYLWIKKIWRIINFLPNPLRKSISKFLLLVNSRNYDFLFKIIFILFSKYKTEFPGKKVHRLAKRIENIHSINGLYLEVICEWNNTSDLLPNLKNIDHFHNFDKDFNKLKEIENRMMLGDSLLYLPNDILVKMDRASMSNSLEVRSPFLDKDVVEFSWNVPLKMKIANNTGKVILREILEKHLPKNIISNTKKGFAAPISKWLTSSLKEWSENLIYSSSLRKHNIINFSLIERKWREHRLKENNWDQSLWSALIFLDWYEKNR